ncbi:MAG: hypothetical protein AAGE94_09645 [Acidobacteriota bacterium]
MTTASTHTAPSHWKSTTAGIAALIAGALSMLGAAVLLVVGLIAGGAVGFAEESFLPMAGSLLIFGGGAFFCAVFGGIALYGGVETLRRRSFGWAIAGSVATMIMFFPLGMLAVVLVILSEDEIRAANAEPPVPALAAA